MKLKFAIVSSSFFILVGCASALKERCEKTNWFEHSRDVAMDGRYLEEDILIKECKGVDRTNSVQLDLGFKSGRDRYCTYESFLRNGESGEVVNFRMCDGLFMKQMQERYGSGLKKFCTAEVGYTYGASGKVYKKVCFKDAEEKFLPRYFKGRKEFLEKSITQAQHDIDSLDALQKEISPQIHLLTSEINHLPSPQECSSRAIYNEVTKKDESKYICQEASYIRSRRSSLYGSIDNLRSQFTRHAQIISQAMLTLANLRNELVKIP